MHVLLANDDILVYRKYIMLNTLDIKNIFYRIVLFIIKHNFISAQVMTAHNLKNKIG